MPRRNKPRTLTEREAKALGAETGRPVEVFSNKALTYNSARLKLPKDRDVVFLIYEEESKRYLPAALGGAV